MSSQAETNPRELHRKPPFEEPAQKPPGLEKEMQTKPDHGEKSYRGYGRLTGKAALITGGDSGIGRAIAIAYAREGADVAIAHLSDDAEDANETAGWVKDAGARVLDLAGDLRDEAFCRQLIERTTK